MEPTRRLHWEQARFTKELAVLGAEGEALLGRQVGERLQLILRDCDCQVQVVGKPGSHPRNERDASNDRRRATPRAEQDCDIPDAIQQTGGHGYAKLRRR